MNVLLSSAGHHNLLIESFRQALRGRGRVFAADSRPAAPALQEADDILLLPPVGDAHYLDALLEFCEQQKVELFVPLSDLELPLVAAAKAQFAALGTVVAISSAELVARCADKWQSYEVLRAAGLATPRSFLSLDAVKRALEETRVSFPLVVKPRWGMAAVGVEVVYDLDELELSYALLSRRLARTLLPAARTEPAVLVQAYLSGEEYSLDVVNDFSGRTAATLARRKLGQRAGETESALSVLDPEFEVLGARLGALLGHIGNLGCDLFSCDGELFVLELNPRLGNDYLFSHAASANVPAALIAWAQGETPDPEWLRQRAGVAASWFSRLVLIESL